LLSTTPTSTSIRLVWGVPLQPNAFNVSYILTITIPSGAEQGVENTSSNSGLSPTLAPQTSIRTIANVLRQPTLETTITELPSNSKVSLTLQAVSVLASPSAADDVGPGGLVNFSALTLEDRPGSQPQQLTVVAINATAALLAWDQPAIPNGVVRSYQVEARGVRLASGDLVPTVVRVVNTTTSTRYPLSFVLTTLQPFSSYNISVFASTAIGSGPRANVSAHTGQAPPSLSPVVIPGVPRSVGDSDALLPQFSVTLALQPPALVGANGIILSLTVTITPLVICTVPFTASSTCPIPAPLQRSHCGSSPTVTSISIIEGALNATLLLNLSGYARVYNLSVTAETMAGSSPPRMTQIVLPAAAPIFFVPSLQVRTVNSTSAWIEWGCLSFDEARGEPLGYLLSVVSVNSNAQSAVNVSVSGTQQSAMVEGLLPRTDYAISIAMQNRAGWGPRSPLVSFATPSYAPQPPADVAVQSAPLGLTVTWTPITGAALFRLRYFVSVWDASGLPHVLVATQVVNDPFASSTLVANLTGGRLYAVRMASGDADSNSTFSSPVQAVACRATEVPALSGRGCITGAATTTTTTGPPTANAGGSSDSSSTNTMLPIIIAAVVAGVGLILIVVACTVIRRRTTELRRLTLPKFSGVTGTNSLATSHAAKRDPTASPADVTPLRALESPKNWVLMESSADEPSAMSVGARLTSFELGSKEQSEDEAQPSLRWRDGRKYSVSHWGETALDETTAEAATGTQHTSKRMSMRLGPETGSSSADGMDGTDDMDTPIDQRQSATTLAASALFAEADFNEPVPSGQGRGAALDTHPEHTDQPDEVSDDHVILRRKTKRTRPPPAPAPAPAAESTDVVSGKSGNVQALPRAQSMYTSRVRGSRFSAAMRESMLVGGGGGGQRQSVYLQMDQDVNVDDPDSLARASAPSQTRRSGFFTSSLPLSSSSFLERTSVQPADVSTAEKTAAQRRVRIPPRLLSHLCLPDSIEIGRKLSSDYFGNVYEGVLLRVTEPTASTDDGEDHRDSQVLESPVVVNVLGMEVEPRVCQSYLNEASVLLSIQHPNVLRMYGVFVQPSMICLVSESLTMTSVRDWLLQLRQIRQEWASLIPVLIDLGRQTASGLACLERAGIVHRDLSAEPACLFSV
jgi:hypothetical protein